MSKTIFFYVTISLERTEKGVKIIPNKDFEKELNTYRKSVYSEYKDKQIIQNIAEGKGPEFEYPTEMDIKDIEKDLKEKNILSKINTDKYRLKDSYVEKLKDDIKMDKNIEAGANAAQVSPDELNDMQSIAETVVADSSVPKDKEVRETAKRFDKNKKNRKPWFKNRFNKFRKKDDNKEPTTETAPATN